MRPTLRLDRVVLVELALFETDTDDPTFIESTAATDIPFGFAPEEYGDDD